MATIIDYLKSDVHDFAWQLSVIREEFGATLECRRGALLILPKEAATMKLKTAIFLAGLILGLTLGMGISHATKSGFAGFGGGTTRGHGASSSW